MMEEDLPTSWFNQTNPQSDASDWYVVSMQWLSRWKESVIEGHSTEIGVIDNSDILDHTDHYTIADHVGSVVTKQGLTYGLEYELVPKDVWEVLKAKHGVLDGSEVLRRRVQISLNEAQVEVTLRPLLLVFLYKGEGWSLTKPKPLFVSRYIKASSIAGFALELLTSTLQLSIPPNPIKLRKLAAETDLTEFEATCVKSKGPCTSPLIDYKKSLNEAEVADTDIILIEVPDASGVYKLPNYTDIKRVKCLCGQLIQGAPTKCTCGQVNFCSQNCLMSLRKIHSCVAGGNFITKGKKKPNRSPLVASTAKKGSTESIDNQVFSIKPGSKFGICGLQNLGNTCFMNSALQCMSHIKPLTDFFLNDLYKNDLNVANPLGSKKCRVAKSYAHLIKTLWLDSLTSFAPWNFKGAIGEFAPVFQGFQQHDSQEMLAFTLDALHEDLNRIVDKPYNSEIRREGLTEDELANEYWNQFLSRNSSIVTDYMYGQYRSEVTCPICSNVSLAFDPFLMLSVVLPITVTKAINVSFLRLDGSPEIRMAFVTNKKPTVLQVKKAVQERLMLTCPLLAASYSDSVLREFMKDEASTSILGEKERLVLLEAPESAPNMVKIALDFTKEDPYVSHSRAVAGISRYVLVEPTYTLQQVHIAVFESIMPQRTENFRSCFPSLFSQEGKDIYTLRVVVKKNYQKQPEIFTTKRKKNKKHSSHGKKPAPIRCTLCDKPNCTNCVVEFSDSITLSELLAKRNLASDMHFEVVLPSTSDLIGHLKAFTEHESVANAKRAAEETKRDHLTLDDCLRFSTQPEKLREENAIYCSNCKAHVQGNKQMSVYRLPRVLIIHLKRFKQAGGFLKKLDTLVRFPVDGFDMSEYLVGPKVPAVYDLFAVSNHSGGIGGGHYTAYCRNIEAGGWHHFNDSSVSVSSKDGSGVVTSAAYVLLYMLRDPSVGST